MMAKVTSTLWANIILTQCDTVLAKVKDSVSFESFMDLCSAWLSNTELFPADILEKAVGGRGVPFKSSMMGLSVNLLPGIASTNAISQGFLLFSS